jgi:hypothetical protein
MVSKKIVFSSVILFAACMTLALSTWSCKKTKYNEITDEEEAEWMIFDRYQKFYMASTQGEIDTFEVVRKAKAYYNPNYEEFIEAEVRRLDDTLQAGVQDGGLYMRKTSKGLSVKVWLPHFGEKIDITKRTSTVANVNGKNYPDVFILPVNQLYLDFDNYIDTIYYSKSFGFLKYVDIYGEEWTKYN